MSMRLRGWGVSGVLTLGFGLAVSAAHGQPAPAGDDGQCAYTRSLGAPPALLKEAALDSDGGAKLAQVLKNPQAMQYIRETVRQEQVRNAKDWGQLCRYKAANAEQAASGAPRIVFLGDSITELWGDADPTLFSAKVLDRGISGQTSSQILLRVYPDVIALHPTVLHLMAGTNDVLGQTGQISDDDIVDNVRAMIELAQANGIAVVLASLPPSQGFMGRADLHPAERIARLNDRFRRLAAERKAIFADYHAVLDNGQGGMQTELSNDGLHPNRAGYARMRPVVESALRKAAG